MKSYVKYVSYLQVCEEISSDSLSFVLVANVAEIAYSILSLNCICILSWRVNKSESFFSSSFKVLPAWWWIMNRSNSTVLAFLEVLGVSLIHREEWTVCRAWIVNRRKLCFEIMNFLVLYATLILLDWSLLVWKIEYLLIHLGIWSFSKFWRSLFCLIFVTRIAVTVWR